LDGSRFLNGLKVFSRVLDLENKEGRHPFFTDGGPTISFLRRESRTLSSFRTTATQRIASQGRHTMSGTQAFYKINDLILGHIIGTLIYVSGIRVMFLNSDQELFFHVGHHDFEENGTSCRQLSEGTVLRSCRLSNHSRRSALLAVFRA